MYGNYLKRESNPNKKWNLVRMSLEHTTLQLLAQRSADWANRTFDTNVQQIEQFLSNECTQST